MPYWDHTYGDRTELGPSAADHMPCDVTRCDAQSAIDGR